MSDKVQCQTHGEQEATYVCRHIMDSIDTGKAVGFHWPRDSDMSRPDAWCTECEQVRQSEGGDWTDTAMKFVDVSVLCGGCYDRAKAIWLRARAS
ncbi:MAG TPA: hypothetical protein VKR55_09015 [Bradyrhizobium sp.]|uniref:hypothetical protein n=1 Tax=Bradyrhizobium sp. TaxID=376 RepID=UPI002BCF5046|nr:hypothetical protein [Bradyrhizobium sp.]HLZ02279.1 hypothetical protein [Bradyrhizobium sp.]